MDGFYLSPFEDAYLSKIGGKKMDKFELVRFTDNGFELDVRADLQHDTVWLTQEEIARLFGAARSTVTYHINNIFSSEELDKKHFCRKIRRKGELQAFQILQFGCHSSSGI